MLTCSDTALMDVKAVDSRKVSPDPLETVTRMKNLKQHSAR